MHAVQLRIPEETHLKARVLAAYRGVSMNRFTIDAIADQVAQHEAEHGEIPMLHQVRSE